MVSASVLLALSVRIIIPYLCFIAKISSKLLAVRLSSRYSRRTVDRYPHANHLYVALAGKT